MSDKRYDEWKETGMDEGLDGDKHICPPCEAGHHSRCEGMFVGLLIWCECDCDCQGESNDE